MTTLYIDESAHLTPKREAIARTINEVLPHGSGIDGEWQFRYTSPTRLQMKNFYTCMDENGMKDGYVDFTVLIDIVDPDYFVLQFNGDRSRYLAKKYDIRDFLNDTICELLHYAFGGAPIHANEDYDYN